MTRCWQVTFCIAMLNGPLVVDAQYRGFQQHPHQQTHRTNVYVQPIANSQGAGFHGYRGPGPAHYVAYPIVVATYFPQPVQYVPYFYPVNFVPVAAPSPQLPAKPQIAGSTAAARLKSLEHQVRGDQKMREQKWLEARVAYGKAISAAPDRAEAYLRLGLCFVVTQRYDLAVREFKRAVNRDPLIPATAPKLESLLGPNGKIVRTSIMSKLGIWVGEDIRDSDRLFLFGAMLYLNGDSRAHEMLNAALTFNMSGDVDHINSFLNHVAKLPKDIGAAVPQPLPKPDGPPKLNDQPVPVLPRPTIDLRFPKPSGPLPDAPVPMP